MKYFGLKSPQGACLGEEKPEKNEAWLILNVLCVRPLGEAPLLQCKFPGATLRPKNLQL